MNTTDNLVESGELQEYVLRKKLTGKMSENKYKTLWAVESGLLQSCYCPNQR